MTGLGPLVTVSRQELLKDIEKSMREKDHDPKKPEVAKAMTEVLGEMPISLLYTSMGRAYREGKLAFFHDAVDRLLFDRNEVAIAREERELRRARAELVRAVILLYFERRRLQLERDLGHAADLGREIRITELEALLNAFTDGAFHRMMSVR